MRGAPMSDQASRDATAEAIVVPNTLWTVADPEAYGGGRPTENTHLAELEASGLGRRDDARWTGPLEIIPTKADYVLDLIRVNSLWPLLSGLACCAIEMISAATSKHDMDRFGWFPFRASPRQADVLIVAGTCTTKMASRAAQLRAQRDAYSTREQPRLAADRAIAWLRSIGDAIVRADLLAERSDLV